MNGLTKQFVCGLDCLPTEKDWTGQQPHIQKAATQLNCLFATYGAMKWKAVVGGGGCTKTARAGPACHVIVFQFVFRLKLHIIIPIPILQSLLRQLYLPLVVTFGTNCASPSCPYLRFLSVCPCASVVYVCFQVLVSTCSYSLSSLLLLLFLSDNSSAHRRNSVDTHRSARSVDNSR